MSYIVPIIVAAIILVQVYFFKKNLERMNEYSQIFLHKETWSIVRDSESDFVSGISGDGNKVFDSIKDSINKYLGNNSGSVIDFQLLKDAVDRHCDSVENDVNTLTPIPLYCGLAGTMAGVIIGLLSLLNTGSITALLSSGSSSFDTAAIGVNDLLSGVAWAMIASICGIVLTTAASILFKSRKIQGETGKNSFIAWLQSRLLPELPTDTSEALNRLVVNLNKFNNSFAQNTSELRNALSSVNESYRYQADIIESVQKMDVMKMATANIKVMKDFQQCTERLENFNQFLEDAHTYVSELRVESNRLHVLEEIRDYFTRHKAEISKREADIDANFKEALSNIREHSVEGSNELYKVLTEQAEMFRLAINDQKESFEVANRQIIALFSQEVHRLPMVEKKLSEISEIPSKLDKLIDRIEKSNSAMVSQVGMMLRNNTPVMQQVSERSMKQQSKEKSGSDGWVIVVSLLPVLIIIMIFLFAIVKNA